MTREQAERGTRMHWHYVERELRRRSGLLALGEDAPPGPVGPIELLEYTLARYEKSRSGYTLSEALALAPPPVVLECEPVPSAQFQLVAGYFIVRFADTEFVKVDAISFAHLLHGRTKNDRAALLRVLQRVEQATAEVPG